MESVLKNINGVISADASFIRGQAVIKYDPDLTTPQALAEAINQATPYRASIPVMVEDNFTAGAKSLLVEFVGGPDPRRTYQVGLALKQQPGISDINVRQDGSLVIVYDPKVTEPSQIVSNIKSLGHRLKRTRLLDLSDEGRSGSGWPLKWPAVALLALALVAAIFASRKFGKKSKHLKRRGEELNESQDE